MNNNVVTFGFGRNVALVLTLGFGSTALVSHGSYITFGQGQNTSKFAMLGLSPRTLPASHGSYITFGQGQDVSKFAMLGLSPGTSLPPEPETPPVIISGRPRALQRFPIPADLRAFDDDEIFMWVIANALASGVIR